LSNDTRQRFHILREIDSGGFGSVFLAKMTQGDGFSRLAALKLLHAKWSDSEEIASRMRDEARMLGLLRHPNIVDVFGLTRIDGRVAIVMEYLDAVDCHNLVGQRGTEHELPVRCALEIIAAAASALDAAYNRPPVASDKPLRVIHRDIKPSNLMIDGDGVTKVLDFGGARGDFDEREAKTEAMTFGSIDYMPPERLFMEPEVPASDVYSLGATLFEMLCGEALGKAKLKPEAQDVFVLQRFEVLLERNPLGNERVAEEVLVLLRDMLGFNADDRPTAAKVVQVLRPLARAFPEQPTLAEWAERHIPPLLAIQNDKRTERTRSELIGSVVEEDNYDGTRSDPIPTALPTPAAPRANDLPLPPPPPRGPAPSASHAHSASDDDPPTSTAKHGSGLFALFVVFVIAVILGVVAVITVGGAIGYISYTETPTVQVPVTPPPPPETKPPEPVAPEPPKGPAATFVSHLPDTRTITVRCDKLQGRGDTTAYVEGDTFGKCTVTAVTADRKRATIVLDKVKPRVYNCFADGDKGCN